jgi:anti-anti-sigma factor
MENISITEKNGSNYTLLEVAGTINSYTYTEFQDKVYSIVKQTNLVLDLSRVVNLSSSGLGVLMSALDDAESAGKKLYVMKPSEVVRLAIESTGFSDMFTVIYSLTEVI